MKKKFLPIVICIFVFSALASCSYENPVKANTPTNTAWLTKLAINNNDYERFNSYFIEERKGVVSKDMLEELSKISTAAGNYNLYELITFTSGEMLLVQLTTEKIDGEYKIEDVVIVPEEMKKLFQTDDRPN